MSVDAMSVRPQKNQAGVSSVYTSRMTSREWKVRVWADFPLTGEALPDGRSLQFDELARNCESRHPEHGGGGCNFGGAQP